MFSSLRARLWLSYALLIITALSVTALVFGIFLWRNPLLYRQTLGRLRAVETAIARRQNNLVGDSLPRALERTATEFEVRVLVFSALGELQIDTGGAHAKIHLPEKDNTNRGVPTLRDENGEAWIYTRKALDDGRILVVVARRPRVSLVNIIRDDLLPIFMQGGVIALILALILAFVVARWVADPLQGLITASQHEPVTSAEPVSERGPREVRELTRAFNEMIDRVRSSQTSQRNFVANVSHELKTPLTSIQGFAQAIMDGTAHSPEEQKQAAEVIYNESGRMHRMVLDLLDLARLDAGTMDLKMVPIDLAALLDNISEKFELQAQKNGISIIVDVHPNLPTLIADGDRLAQVFTNLVDNAIRHTPSGGQVALGAQSTQNEMEIRVADTGAGIPADVLPYIYDRFYQADLSRSGSSRGAGLGLAIVKEIVVAHNGRITVRSQEGLGTTFFVYLPLVQPAATTLLRKK